MSPRRAPVCTLAAPAARASGARGALLGALLLGAILLVAPRTGHAQTALNAPPASLPTRPPTIDLSAQSRMQPAPLARVFFSPSERREREVDEANALHGPRADLDAHAARPSNVRFNGWLSGPAATHTWVNGEAQASGQNKLAEYARFDARTQRLVVLDANGREVHLRAGESLDQVSAGSPEEPPPAKPEQP